jgi:hypothetical protein
MDFRFATGSKNWRENIQDRALELLEVSQPGKHDNVTISMSELIPRYRLSSRQEIEGGVAAALEVGWRTVLFAENEPVAAVDLAGEDFEVDGCVGDTAFKNFLAALNAAEQIKDASPYEIRLLESPAILFSALWLHGDPQDLLVPLVDEEDLRAFKPVRLADADPLLRRRAEKQLAAQKRYREHNG